ncbi:transcription-repair coupling factor [Trichlorobacter ammonificans]|uniref:Transcription-repair-coupling factor n=1 Tax=Trichlorobacter ammonificans TaxID=2916410 RepID=A0ABM9DDF9_9BACT|nr:transcription-repair coupling factor [Trichlorobacter ammonificans]CAH2032498.1 Transcription-repair-coupling factor [Trichlorobacter ammonificans]
MDHHEHTTLHHFTGSLTDAVAAGGNPIILTGAAGAGTALAIALLSQQVRRHLLVVTPDQATADELVRELDFFDAAGICSFPAWETAPFDSVSPHPDISGARLSTLVRLGQEAQATVVAPVAALLQRVLPPGVLATASCRLAPGDEPDREELLERLVRMGYVNVPLVEERGTFAVRGGILDLFPPSMARPVRIEFFGDQVETLRQFDPLSQRSHEPLQELLLLPSRELILDTVTLERFLPRLKERADALDIPADRRRTLTAELQEAGWPGGIEYLQPLFQPDLVPFTAYLAAPLLVLVEPERVREQAALFARDISLGEQKAREEGRLYPEPADLFLNSEQMRVLFEGCQRLEIPVVAVEDELHAARVVALASEENRDLKVSVAPERQHALEPLAARLRGWLEQEWQLLLVCHQSTQAERMRTLLEGYRIPCVDIPPGSGLATALAATQGHRAVGIALGQLSRGVRLPRQRCAVIAEEELFGKRTRRKSGVSALRTKQILASLAELKPGDPMVHVDHGIGIYRGLHHLKTGTVEGDFLLLEYAGSDKLYLPIDRLGLVQRYVGGEGAVPQVARLGGSGWEKTRSKARKAVEELAGELLEIYARRQAAQGFGFSPPDELFREFEATFPWEETPDQLNAIQDVLGDMQHTRPMDRLVCGDVGYGKTEVALRAAFKAVLDGKQVAVLVPTTILAQQHFETFRERLKEYPLTVEALSRFRSAKEQKEILERLKAGKVDIVVGTHRLLQKDVAFKDLGLLIVDEEQRFGVKDKERLKQYRASVDILTLTATPIPRTLHLSMMGIRDLSIIDTPPVDRQAIRTVVARDRDELVRDAVMRELERGGQVFYVHNRVQSIGLVAERLRRLVPEARIAVAHGQMEEKELEKVMLGFMRGDTNLLLSTTIIESGLDIPRANTMLVDRADTFGLSQLYQLRGRIGRSTVQGHAFLLIPGEGSITQDARERLKVIQELTELGAGFRIATHDLELRGAGDLLGPRQSGTVADIGFEYYTQLLEEAIANLKGEQREERCEPEINLAVSGFIPESYVPDTSQRLVLYKRLVQAETEQEVTELRGEMEDRYGHLPAAVETLVRIMGLRIQLKRLKIQKIDADGRKLVLTFHPRTTVQPDLLITLIRKEPAAYQFTPDHRLVMQLADSVVGSQVIEAAAGLLQRLAAP